MRRPHGAVLRPAGAVPHRAGDLSEAEAHPRLADLPRVEVASRAAWRDWLAAHHRASGSVWCLTFKRPDPRQVPYAEVVEEALCFGWVDSRPAKLDAARSMLLVSPRREGSDWSALNKTRVERLKAECLMAPAGLASVQRARREGTWEALDAVEALTVPDDLAAALAARPGAADAWAAFPRSVRRGALEWLDTARRPATRARRVEDTAERAARGERPGPFDRRTRPPAGRESG